MMSCNFWYQTFVAVSGKLGGKVSVVYNVLSSHEQAIYPNTAIEENCLELDFQTDVNYYGYLRQMYFALKLKYVKGCGYENYNTDEVKKRTKRRLKWIGKRRCWRNKRFHFLSLLMYTIEYPCLHSMLPNVDVYINNLQFYNSDGSYAHKYYFFNKFEGGISQHKRISHCQV